MAVVRALINQPKLLFADEPTGALDHASAERMGELLVELNRDDKVTLVTVTHWPGWPSGCPASMNSATRRWSSESSNQ